MKKAINTLLAILLLSLLAYVLWVFKVWIICISLVLVLISVIIERITGKPSKLRTWTKKR